MIRYRCWDTTHGKMFYPEQSLTLRGLIFTISMEGKCYLNGELAENQDRLIFMLSTGLRDKNVKEIFEGDILKADESYVSWYEREREDKDDEDRLPYGRLLVVDDIIPLQCTWIKGELFGYEGEMLLSKDFAFLNTEVIGDIYTTPELLEEKK